MKGMIFVAACLAMMTAVQAETLPNLADRHVKARKLPRLPWCRNAQGRRDGWKGAVPCLPRR